MMEVKVVMDPKNAALRSPSAMHLPVARVGIQCHVGSGVIALAR